MLSLNGLCHRYTPASTLRFPDVQVPAGTHLLVTGASGSGKSTLLALMAGLLTPHTGSVQVNGTDVGSLGARARDAWRGRTLGFVPQRLHLSASLSVHDNLRLPYVCTGEAVDDARIAEVLSVLGIGTLARRRPHELSMGQAQRVAIARAVLRRPQVLLADEPTASLDDRAARDVIELLHQAAAGAPAMLVVATHDRRCADALAGAHVLHLERAA